MILQACDENLENRLGNVIESFDLRADPFQVFGSCDSVICADDRSRMVSDSAIDEGLSFAVVLCSSTPQFLKSFDEIEAHGRSVIATKECSRFEAERRSGLAEWCSLSRSVFNRWCGFVRRDLQRERRAGVGSGQDQAAVSAFDLRQLASGPVPRNLAQLHPEQVVVAFVQSLHDFFEHVEAVLFAVEVEAGPVADEDRRLTSRDDLRQAASLQIGRDELVDRSLFEAVPAAKPIASTTMD